MNKQEIENLIAKLRKENEEYSDKEAYQDDFRRNLILIDALEKQLTNGWIPVSERLPENDNPVEATARRKEGARGYFIYKACYVAPHTQTTEDYGWDIGNVDGEYDEENDCFWVPECWYEDNAIADNGNYILDDEFDILAWRELPEPWKGDTK